MNIIWITDPHFNFLPEGGAEYIGKEFADQNPDSTGCLITGDLSESKDLSLHLSQFVKGYGKDVWYVLGNHDFYGGSVGVSDTIEGACHLTKVGPVKLSESTMLVGDDGWYDATAGNPYWSNVHLGDFDLILNFAGMNQYERIEQAHQLGVRSANRIEQKLRSAAKQSKRVVVAVHVPPWKEASWHEGRMSNDDWLPWFTHVEMGKVIEEVAGEYKDVKFDVFCGHCHSSGFIEVTENVTCSTGKAKYGDPQLAGMIEI
jgi:Icc protein